MYIATPKCLKNKTKLNSDKLLQHRFWEFVCVCVPRYLYNYMSIHLHIYISLYHHIIIFLYLYIYIDIYIYIYIYIIIIYIYVCVCSNMISFRLKSGPPLGSPSDSPAALAWPHLAVEWGSAAADAVARHRPARPAWRAPGKQWANGIEMEIRLDTLIMVDSGQ